MSSSAGTGCLSQGRPRIAPGRGDARAPARRGPALCSAVPTASSGWSTHVARTGARRSRTASSIAPRCTARPRLGVRRYGRCTDLPALADRPGLRERRRGRVLRRAGARRPRVRVPRTSPGAGAAPLRPLRACRGTCATSVALSSRATGCRSWRTASTPCTSSGCTANTCARVRAASRRACGDPLPRAVMWRSVSTSSSTAS